MRSRTTLLATSVLSVLLAGCSGGSSDSPAGLLVPDGGGSSVLQASFTADVPHPGPQTVAMLPYASSANTVTVAFDVEGVLDIGSAGFDLLYDPNAVEFVGWSLGPLFPSCESSTLCLVDTSLPGRVVFGISATGGATYDAANERTLVRVVLRALEPGSHTVSFDNAALKDGAVSDIPGIDWHGGAVLAD